MIAFAVLAWSCVAHSYTIRNMYKRMPVDRSSQGVGQVMLDRNSNTSKSQKARQSSEPAGIPLPAISLEAKQAVLGVRKDLSNLGGSILGGFAELTGLKLKQKPGFDIPFLPDIYLGSKSLKKAGTEKSKLVVNLQREKQFKRQTSQPNFDAPPYVAQKELPTIWYSESKKPLHLKIGDDLKSLVGSVFGQRPGFSSNLFQEDNTIDTGSVRGERNSAYGAPASPSYGAPEEPAQSYGAPAVSAPSYGAPAEPSYGAPAEPNYSAPAQPSYGAPAEPSYATPAEPSYGSPVEATYGAPEVSYDVPTYGVEGEDVLKTMIYGSEEKLPLLMKIITDYNKVFNFYAGQSAQIAAFYAPGLIPILKKFGFDVKRIKWVPELINKFKPSEEDGYGAPVSSYGEPAITYEEAEPAYGAPAATYEEPSPSYGFPAATYEEPAPAYGAPAPSYQEPAPVAIYQPVASEPVPVYHAQESSYAAPNQYYSPAHNSVYASSKRAKKHVKGTPLEVTPDHHEELLTSVPALELLKLKKKLNRKEARERSDKEEERSSRQLDEIEAEDPTSRLKETLQRIEEIVEEDIENEMSEA